MIAGLRFGETATHRRRVQVGTSIKGIPEYEWHDLPPLRGVSLQEPRAMYAVDSSGVYVRDELVLYVPPEADIRTADKVIVRGREYNVIDHPLVPVNIYTGHEGMKTVRVRSAQAS